LVSDLLKLARSLPRIEAAWSVVRTNGLSSKSELSQRDIQVFDDDAAHNLRSLASRLRRNSFKFPPARGVPIKKPGRKKIRPLVIGGVESRIVQRSILDVLLGVEGLQPYFLNPHSFGGIKRRKEDTLAAVPAAVKAVLEAIEVGARENLNRGNAGHPFL
jgi:RNA-directed DNA polymerase